MKFIADSYSRIEYYVRCLRLLLLLSSTKAIVWDVDGTLYFSDQLIKDLRQQYLGYYSEQGGTKAEFIQQEKLGRDWDEIIQSKKYVSSKKLIQRIEKKIVKEKYISPNPQLVRAVSFLKHQQFLFSNSNSQQLNSILKALQFEQPNNVFQELITLDHLPEAKPASSAFDVLSKVVLPQSGKAVLYIGDSIKHDMRPAQAKGFRTIYLNHWGKEFPADLTYPNLEQFLNALYQIKALYLMISRLI